MFGNTKIPQSLYEPSLGEETKQECDDINISEDDSIIPRPHAIPSKLSVTLEDGDGIFDDNTVENEVIDMETNNPPGSIYLRALPPLLAAARCVLPEEHQEHHEDWSFLTFHATSNNIPQILSSEGIPDLQDGGIACHQWTVNQYLVKS